MPIVVSTHNPGPAGSTNGNTTLLVGDIDQGAKSLKVYYTNKDTGVVEYILVNGSMGGSNLLKKFDMQDSAGRAGWVIVNGVDWSPLTLPTDPVLTVGTTGNISPVLAQTETLRVAFTAMSAGPAHSGGNWRVAFQSPRVDVGALGLKAGDLITIHCVVNIHGQATSNYVTQPGDDVTVLWDKPSDYANRFTRTYLGTSDYQGGALVDGQYDIWASSYMWDYDCALNSSTIIQVTPNMVASGMTILQYVGPVWHENSMNIDIHEVNIIRV